MVDRRITIREVPDDVGISIGSGHEIFSNILDMKRVAAKFIPKLLNLDQKLRRIEVAPCHFFLFPKIKKTLKDRRFTSIDDIKSASLNELKTIPNIEVEKCFKDWQKHCHKCIVSDGDYFEGNNINVDE